MGKNIYFCKEIIVKCLSGQPVKIVYNHIFYIWLGNVS